VKIYILIGQLKINYLSHETLDEDDSESMTHALNSPDWHRVLVASHPLIRLYDTWDQMFSLKNKDEAKKWVNTLGLEWAMKAIKHHESHLVTFIQFLQKLNKKIEAGEEMNFALLPLYDLCGFCLSQVFKFPRSDWLILSY